MVCSGGSYPVHTELHGRGTRLRHSGESSGMPRRPTAWSLGHIVPCSQRSWNPSPLEQNKARQPEDGLQPFSSDGQNCLTSHHVYHPFQHRHPQPTTSLVNGGHGGPVLVKGVEALHAAQCPAVTPTAALQPSVSSCRMDTGQVDVDLATSYHQISSDYF